MVPFAKLGDPKRAAVLESEIASECTGKPQCLQFKFWGKFRSGDLLECKGRMPNALK
jgi:hypothetical protein